MYSQNWCQVPSCLKWWYRQRPMESYIWGPPGYLYVCTTWAPVPWKFLHRLWLDRLPLPTKCHQQSTHPGLPKSLILNPKRDGSWRPWTSKASKNGSNQSRSRPKSCWSKGTPVCAQWPGPEQNCSDQTQNRGDGLDIIQGALSMHTSPHIWWCEGPYPGDAGY